MATIDGDKAMAGRRGLARWQGWAVKDGEIWHKSVAEIDIDIECVLMVEWPRQCVLRRLERKIDAALIDDEVHRARRHKQPTPNPSAPNPSTPNLQNDTAGRLNGRGPTTANSRAPTAAMASTAVIGRYMSQLCLPGNMQPVFLRQTFAHSVCSVTRIVQFEWTISTCTLT